MPARHRDTETAQHLFCLIFVDVHAMVYPLRVPGALQHDAVQTRDPGFLLPVSFSAKEATGVPHLRSNATRCIACGTHNHHHFAKPGAIFLQASINVCTDPTEPWNISRSALLSSISTMRSTPFAPITTGTPT